MTIGIYRLCFSGTDRCYVGQSINIEKRYKQHIASLKGGNATQKMLAAFSNFGFPVLEILCECLPEELDDLEIEAICVFDSVNNGFNLISSKTPNLRGESHSRSKYTNIKIIEVAELSANPDNTFKEISNLTGVSINTVRDVANLVCHGWLEDVLPEIYKKLVSIKGSRNGIRKSAKSLGITYPPVLSPEGRVYKSISNLRDFCRQHILDQSHFTKLLNGKAKTHKGWRLADNV
jgi:hypothetical protein